MTGAREAESGCGAVRPPLGGVYVVEAELEETRAVLRGVASVGRRPTVKADAEYLAPVGFGEVIRVLANNLDKPVNLTNGPKGITPISRPPVPLDVPPVIVSVFDTVALLVPLARVRMSGTTPACW